MTCPFLEDLWRDVAGLPPEPPKPALPSLDILRQTEWNPEFEQLMRNRLLMGCFRYERLHEKTRGSYDIIGSVRTRLEHYENDGNLEHLVDIANLMLIEFMYSNHPKRHFSASDDGHHTQRTNP